jgi:DNA-binding transcriptional ArsR family regulator
MQTQPDSPDAYEAIFDALAHPVRRRILISLNFAGGTMSAGEIARLFGHAWPTTTRHLQVMMAAGLVSQERKGRVRAYRLESGRLALARDWLGWFARDPVTGKEIENDRAGAVQDQHRSRRA